MLGATLCSLCSLVLSTCTRCNSLGYVDVDAEAPEQFPHRDVLRDLLPPSARLYSVFASISGDTPGAAGGWFVPNSAEGLPPGDCPSPQTPVRFRVWGGGPLSRGLGD